RPYLQGTARIRRWAKRTSRTLSGHQHPVQREPRSVPGDARHSDQGMDPGAVLAPRKVLSIPGRLHHAQALPEASSPDAHRGQARDEAEASTMGFFRSISKALKKSDGATAQTAEARVARSNRLAEISYDEVLADYAVFGTPEAVADRLLALREEMGFSTLSMWMNPGGTIPNERVLKSMRLFAERVAPRLA